MPGGSPGTILLVCGDGKLRAAIEPVLQESGKGILAVDSPEGALPLMVSPEPPALILVDSQLFLGASAPTMARWLTDVRMTANGHRFPVVLIADEVEEGWMELLAEGALDDLIPRSPRSPFWKLRLTLLLRTLHRMRELDTLRESAAMDAKLDALTSIYNRSTLLSIMFRETDRVQRMKTPLSVVLFDIDGFSELNQRVGCSACDDLLCQVVTRTMKLLRSYDVFGRMGNDEFLLVLPGCATADAMMLSERLRVEVFGQPYQVGGEPVRLSACFGIAPSQGRSPVVVLRAAEIALARAKRNGNESIECAGSKGADESNPADFLSTDSDKEVLAW